MNDLRKQNTKAWKTDLKAPKVAPLMVNCFKCGKEFGIKWVIGRQAYSQKNSWAYWTGETEGDKKICDNCLIRFSRDDKKLYWEKVKDPKIRDRMSSYICHGDIRPS